MRMREGTVNLSTIAQNTPALPDSLQAGERLTGHGSWEIVSAGCICSSPSTMTETEQDWDLTCDRPVVCQISADQDMFAFPDTESNGLAILFLGWSYVLCMALVEMQGRQMIYVADPRVKPRVEQTIKLYMGEISDEELRWWRSVLSPGQCYRTADSGRQPTWAVNHQSTFSFAFVATAAVKPPLSASPQLAPPPPSSRQAADFLARFAGLYGLESQVPLALAMALTTPLQRLSNSVITLPLPNLIRPAAQSPSPPCTSAVHRELDSLSRYMTFSAAPLFVSAALWGVFWEPGVPCNLVSPWFDGVVDTIRPLIADGNVELLAHVLAIRRPQVASLWFGVLACGKTETSEGIVNFLQSGWAPTIARPIPAVTAWTGSPLSFIDTPGSGAYVREDGRVLREDVWRLRHQNWRAEPDGLVFRNFPLCPWPPFGSIHVNELELAVRSSTACERHRRVYVRWTWRFGDKTVTEETQKQQKKHHTTASDSQGPDSPPRKPTDDLRDTLEYFGSSEASKSAVRDIFRWSMDELEPSGKEVYSHGWVELIPPDEESDFEDGASGGSEKDVDFTDPSHQGRIEQWINTLDR